MLTENESAGAMDLADHVNHFAFGTEINVVWKNLDIFFRRFGRP